MTVNKEHLINTISNRLDLPKKKTSHIIESLVEKIKGTLASGEDILISGFGKFCVKEKKIRRGRNPHTGDDLVLDARRVVTFKVSSNLKEKINPQKSPVMDQNS